MTIPPDLPDFREKLHRATLLVQGWLAQHVDESNNIHHRALIIWRHARGNTALREALVLRGALSVARNARRFRQQHSIQRG